VAAVLAIAGLPGLASAQPRGQGGARPRAAVDTGDAAFLAADDAFFASRLRAQRTALLARAGWADLGDRCNPGALRIFPADTAPAQRLELEQFLERMMATIVARGVGASVDTRDGRALVRTVVGWEAGIDRPHWDADEPTVRPAIAAGLTGEVPDPTGPGCLPPPSNPDTVTFVIPAITDMTFPNADRPRVKAYLGPGAVRHVRDEFVVAHKGDPEALLEYIHVAPVVIWREWGLVRVRRPVEPGGFAVDADGRGGATYLFRRVGSEWRLLAIVRTWGK
jgi:hypothetical protein